MINGFLDSNIHFKFWKVFFFQNLDFFGTFACLATMTIIPFQNNFLTIFFLVWILYVVTQIHIHCKLVYIKLELSKLEVENEQNKFGTIF